jgi:high affinity Mn2+ porin
METALRFVMHVPPSEDRSNKLTMTARAALCGGMYRGLAVAISLVAFAHSAAAADMPVKAPPPVAPAADDWTGFYLGGHIGYAAGVSRWSATSTGAAAPPLFGSLDLFNSYDVFKGTGSYFAGFQAGYNHVTPSRWLFGVEADVSFPSTIAGTSTLNSPATGTASFTEQVEFSGTLRGRVGYAPNLGGTSHWLFYATGGLAWSVDQFSRMQIAGTPAGGTAVPGQVENRFLLPRFGASAGVGVEYALPSHWSARLEYLFTGYGNRGVTFPAGAQRFSSDLALNELRFGLNYRLNADTAKSATKAAANAAEPPALETDIFAIHGQTTFLEQYVFPFRSPYFGPHSLDPNQGRESFDATAFLGLRLWRGAEFWADAEIDQGFGLSNTFGVAGFPSGESFKLGASVPYARVSRAFLRQTIDLGGETEKIDGDANRFSGTQTKDRLVLTVGKFNITDVFDTNKYAHDPKNDFMNWSLIDTGSFDYASDAWGYSYGAAVEWYQGDWTVRGGVFDLSNSPGSVGLDPTFSQFQGVGEIERRYQLWGQPGKLAVTGFLSRGNMGSFQDAIALAAATGGPANIAAVRRYNSRGGISLNLEQQINDQVGVFARAGWAGGGIEPFDVTDIDRTVAAGVAVNGKSWGRPDDTVGLAGVVNGIAPVHQRFLNAGGLGILIGDGMLPHPGLEQIIEAYYQLPVSFFKLTLDYQFIVNPAYNADRGPASVIAARMHAQF